MKKGSADSRSMQSSRVCPQVYMAAVKGTARLRALAGAAKPSPQFGQALGPLGVNMMEFCKQFNSKTEQFKETALMRVRVTVCALVMACLCCVLLYLHARVTHDEKFVEIVLLTRHAVPNSWEPWLATVVCVCFCRARSRWPRSSHAILRHVPCYRHLRTVHSRLRCYRRPHRGF